VHGRGDVRARPAAQRAPPREEAPRRRRPPARRRRRRRLRRRAHAALRHARRRIPARPPPRGDPMKLSREDAGEATTLPIVGALDAVTAPELRAVVDALVSEQRKSITVELSNLRLIDSSGVGVIVSLFKRVRAYHGDVRIQGLRDQPKAIFKLLR